MAVMAANKLLRSSTLVLVVVSMALCTLCALPPFSAAQSTSPALPSAAEGKFCHSTHHVVFTAGAADISMLGRASPPSENISISNYES
jgi:hypothetical protein